MELEVVSCIKGREAGSWEEREGAWGRDGGMQEEREEYSREWGRRDHTRDSLRRRGWELMFSPSGGRRTVCFPGCEDPDVYLYMDNRFYSSNNKLLRSHTRMHAHTHWDTAKVHRTLKYSHACILTYPKAHAYAQHTHTHTCSSPLTPRKHLQTRPCVAIPWGYHEQELFLNQLCGSYSWTKTYCENGRSFYFSSLFLRRQEHSQRLVQLPDLGLVPDNWEGLFLKYFFSSSVFSFSGQ